MITGVIGDLVMLGFGGSNIETLEAIVVGAEVEIDNSDFLASQTFHRHQNPPPEFTVWDQFRTADGVPLHPQRPLLRGFDQVGEGNSWQSGRFSCKVITVNSLMDEAAFPWQADWYRTRVQNELGASFADRYRLWFVDHAMHVNPSRYMSPTEGGESAEGHGPTETRVVNYTGVLQQALLDVAAWAEEGIEPPAETSYSLDDGQIVVPPTALERRGVQPVVKLTANGGTRVDVGVGESVDFVGVIDVPPGGGMIVDAEWDYDGGGSFSDHEEFDEYAAHQITMRSRAFDCPGTFFVTLRAASQRPDAVGTRFGRALNLDGVRVVVR